MRFLCKCGSGFNYDGCCGRYIDGADLAQTPEQLMRSRYTAYVLNNMAYIVKTMQGKALKRFTLDHSDLNELSLIWQKLEVINCSTQNNKGFVEFKAYYMDNQQSFILHEISEFKRKSGQWFYVDGNILIG